VPNLSGALVSAPNLYPTDQSLFGVALLAAHAEFAADTKAKLDNRRV